MSLSIMLGILFIVVLPWSAIFFNDRGYKKWQAGQSEDALQDFNIALTLKPGYPIALYNQALAYEDLKNFDLAMENYEVAARGGFAPAYNNLAYLQIKRGDYAQAAKLLEEAMPLKTDLGTKYTLFKNLGWAQLYLHQYSQAEANLRDAITVDSKRGSAYCLLAQVLEKESKLEEHNQWENCLKFSDPNHPDESEWLDLAKSNLKK